jgi:hypothetical protein
MNKKIEPSQKSEVGSVRLANGHIAKLRSLMRANGREWFERWILREHSKLEKK